MFSGAFSDELADVDALHTGEQTDDATRPGAVGLARWNRKN